MPKNRSSGRSEKFIITFDDVRKTDETTFFFFPDGTHNVLTHFLELVGFSEGRDFLVLNYAETQHRYPDQKIPMVPKHPDVKDIPTAYGKPLTLVSHLDPTDMEKKLWEIHGSEEANRWRLQKMNDLEAAIQAENEALRGWLPELERQPPPPIEAGACDSPVVQTAEHSASYLLLRRKWLSIRTVDSAPD